jgi:tetratricopeptide (TPR) repeat protein
MLNWRLIVMRGRKIFAAYQWFFWGAIGIGLLVGISSGGYMLHSSWKIRQSRKLVGSAESYMQERRATEALMAYETALRLNPKNTEAVRGLAMLQYAIGEKGASLLNFQRLADSGAMMPRDAQVFALLAALHLEWELADRIVDSLSSGDPTALPHLISADIAIMRGKLVAAESSLRLAVDIDASAQCRAALAGFLIANRLDKGNATEIFLILNELSASDGGLGAVALAAGIEKNLVPPELIPNWITALRSHPERTEEMLLVADSVEVKLAPENTPITAAKIVERLEGVSVGDRKKGVFWLVNHGQYSLGADLVASEEAFADRDLFGIWLDALAGASRFEELHQVLAHPSNPLAPWQTHLARGRALLLEGRLAEGKTSFEAALGVTSDTPDDGVKVAAYFIHAGENDFMRQGILSALKNDDSASGRFETLRNVVRAKQDMEVSLILYEVALQSGSLGYIHELQNEIEYCRLVLGRKVEAGPVARLAHDNPYNLRFRITNALQLLLRGDSIKGTAALIVPGVMPDDSELRARHAALSVMALASRGMIDEAGQAMGKMSWKALTRQEFEIVRSFVERSGS